MVREDDIRKTPFIIDGHTFNTGGDDDLLQLDFVRDRAQGLGTPAKSLVVRNSGAGTVYFLMSEDGEHWSNEGSIAAGAFEQYEYHDGIQVHTMKLWANNAQTTVSVRAAPGITVDAASLAANLVALKELLSEVTE